jgi:hypothetical protein
MVDCFASLQSNLMDSTGAVAYASDTTMWLKGQVAGKDNGQLWEWLANAQARSVTETLLDKIKEYQALPDLTKSAKDQLGRQRKRLTVINNLQRLSQDQLTPGEIDDLWGYVVENGSKKTFFPKDYPFQTDDEFLSLGEFFIDAKKTPTLTVEIPAEAIGGVVGEVVIITPTHIDEAIAAVTSHGQNHVKKALGTLSDSNPLKTMEYHKVTELHHSGPKPKGVTTKQSVLDWLEAQKLDAAPGNAADVFSPPAVFIKPKPFEAGSPEIAQTAKKIPTMPGTKLAPEPPAPKPPTPATTITAGPKAVTKTPIDPIFTEIPEQIGSAGTHPKLFMEDQEGNRWMFKWFTKTNEEWRSDVEHYAHELGELFGFDMADSRLIDWGGHYGQIQKLWPGDDLIGTPLSSLTKTQRTQIAEHHLLDWLMDNDDTHAANLFQLSHDGSIVGIDKGRAFAKFGTNPLRLGSLSKQNDVVYEGLYRMLHGSVAGKAELDDIYRSVMARAKAMEAITDAEYREVLERLLAGRTNYSTTTASNRTQLIEQALARKNSLSADFDAFYDTIYQRSGLAKPKLADVAKPKADPIRRAGGPAKMPKTQAWTGYSDEFFDAVVDSKASGQSTFWGGRHAEKLRDQAEFLWTERAGSQTVLRGELRLRKAGDDDMMQFLAKYVDTTQGSSRPAPPRSPMDDMLDHPQMVNQLIEAAKTIGYHVSDGQYNPNRIAPLPGIRTRLNQLKGRPRNITPDTPAEWWDALDQQILGYLSDIDMLEQAMATQTAPMWTIARRHIEVVRPKSTPAQGTYTVVKKHEIEFHTEKTSRFNPLTGEVEWLDQVGMSAKGVMYEIDITDNIRVTYVPHDGLNDYMHNNDIAVSVQGRLRLTVKDFKGPDDLTAYRRFLSDAGFDLSPAQDTDLELMYWRMFYNTANQYKTSPTWRQAIANRDQWRAGLTKDPSPAEEIAFLKRNLADTNIMSARQLKIADTEERWKPRFHHEDVSRPEAESGRPWWQRPDWDAAEVDGYIRADTLPSSRWTSAIDRADALQSGGMYSTEERARKLRLTPGGTMSATADQMSGGANGVFTRVNLDPAGFHVFYNMDNLSRMATYSYRGDKYGNLWHRRQHDYAMDRLKSMVDSDNETMIRDVATLLDDIEVVVFETNESRDKLLDFLRRSGIAEIRGVAIEDRFVMPAQRDAAVRRARAEWRRRNGI